MIAFIDDHLGAVMMQTCGLAQHLQSLILSEPKLELLSPAHLNTVCFRYPATNADAVNRQIIIDLQLSGVAAPSMIELDGRIAIRAAVFNHRTRAEDVDSMVAMILQLGEKLASSSGCGEQAGRL